MTPAELEKANLKKQVDTLLELYQAVTEKELYETNEATKVLLRKQAQGLLEDYGKKQTELEQVTKRLTQLPQGREGNVKSAQEQNRLYLHWEEHLPRIDFAKVSTLMPEIIRHKPQGEAAVFLLQDSYRMCGDLCLRHIIEYLARLSTEPPRHIEIGFLEYETPSAQEFLRRMGKYKEIPSEADLNSLVTAIIEKICSGLGTTGVVLVELKIRESLEAYEEFVAWFLCSFWEPLVDRLPQITADRPYVKLIALIHVRNPVPKKALGLYRCTAEEFKRRRQQPALELLEQRTKLLDLPLEKWELEEIKAWLFTYSGLAHPGSGRTTEQIEKAAAVIHKNGKWPNDVYSQIKEMLGQHHTEEEQ